MDTQKFWCSNILVFELNGFGAPGGTRTPDTWLRRPLLYPSELPVQGYSKKILCKYIINMTAFQVGETENMDQSTKKHFATKNIWGKVLAT